VPATFPPKVIFTYDRPLTSAEEQELIAEWNEHSALYTNRYYPKLHITSKRIRCNRILGRIGIKRRWLP
jgi:hypothetical protein